MRPLNCWYQLQTCKSYSITVTLYVCIVHTVCSSQLNRWDSSKLGTLNRVLHPWVYYWETAVHFYHSITYFSTSSVLLFFSASPSATAPEEVTWHDQMLQWEMFIQSMNTLLRTTTNFRTTACNTLARHPTHHTQWTPTTSTILWLQNSQNNKLNVYVQNSDIIHSRLC